MEVVSIKFRIFFSFLEELLIHLEWLNEYFLIPEIASNGIKYRPILLVKVIAVLLFHLTIDGCLWLKYWSNQMLFFFSFLLPFLPSLLLVEGRCWGCNQTGKPWQFLHWKLPMSTSLHSKSDDSGNCCCYLGSDQRSSYCSSLHQSWESLQDLHLLAILASQPFGPAALYSVIPQTRQIALHGTVSALDAHWRNVAYLSRNRYNSSLSLKTVPLTGTSLQTVTGPQEDKYQK